MVTEDEIRTDCEAEFCPAWVPQAAKDAVWAHAWEHGHASGESDVRFYYDDFMDIARALLPMKTAADELMMAVYQEWGMSGPPSSRVADALAAYRKATEAAQ